MTEARRRDGFTILEIMIATAILTLGLVGILALFPVAIHTGKQIVQKSTAVVIAESVAEAIREGIRNQLSYTERTREPFFIFKHDGVMDRIPIPSSQSRPSPRADYYILLPGYGRTTFSGRTAREKALSSAKTFVYPETDRLMNGNGNAGRADDDGDDHEYTFASTKETFKDIMVTQTYTLGNLLPGVDAEENEYVLVDQQIEAIKQYSYAFAITPSINDANLSVNPDQYQPAGRLFHVRVMIFDQAGPLDEQGHRQVVSPELENPPPPVPVFELDFEVSI